MQNCTGNKMELKESDIGFLIKTDDRRLLENVVDDIFDYLKLSKIYKSSLFDLDDYENYITLPTSRIYYREENNLYELEFLAHAYSSVGDRSLYVREFLPLRDRILHKYKPKITRLVYDVDMNEKQRDELATRLFKEDFDRLES